MKPVSVCIVEDLAEIRDALNAFFALQEEVVVLQSFSNAEDAVMSIPALRPDIVVLDIQLPGMSGIDCLRVLRAQCPTAQFMMFTVFENDEKVFEALKAGASGYLLKSTPMPQILAALKELQEGGSPMHALIARKLVAEFQRTGASRDLVELSPRENEVLRWLAKGLLYKEIADKLSIAPGTVRQHIHKIYDKLHVQNRTEAVNLMWGR
jgi:DNA-binding NarL/FixJ family response regulator